MAQFSGNWGVVTAHKYLPDPKVQVAQAREWGVAESWLGGTDVSALIVDDVRQAGRSTSWKRQLPERADWLQRIQFLRIDGNTVFFATPLCVGWSVKQAKETIEAIWSAGASAYIHSEGVTLAEGADLKAFLGLVSKQTNAAAVASHRSEAEEGPAKTFRVTRPKPPKIVLESGPIPKGYCVYRCYGEGGALLYVGCTAQYRKRRHQHRAKSDWFGEVVRVDLEAHDSQRAALDAERVAIWEERPIHNRRRNRPTTVQ
jgi:hypothetical protein